MPNKRTGQKLERNEGLSEYSRELIADASRILGAIFAPREAGADVEEAAFRKLSRTITRTYLIFLLSRMSVEARRALLGSTPDMFTILQKAAEELKGEESESKQLEADLESARAARSSSYFKTATTLRFLDGSSPAVILEKKIAAELRKNSEASEACCYLALTDA